MSRQLSLSLQMDLCQEEAIVRSEADIRAINSSITILRTTRCTCDLAQLLNRNGYNGRHADVILPPIAEEGPATGEDEDSEAFHDVADADPDALPVGITSTGARSSCGLAHSRALSFTMSDSSCDDPSHHHNHKPHDWQIQTVCVKSTKAVDLEK